MELENRNMANKNRDMNKNWREIFEDALWIAQKLGLSSANKLQEHLRELGPPTTVQKQETSRETESKKDGSIEMGDFDRGASISRDDEAIFGKIKVDLVETVHSDGGFADPNKVQPLESTPMLNLHAFHSKKMKTRVGSVKKRKKKEAAGGKEEEKMGIKNPTRIPPNPETQPNPKVLSHSSNPNQFQYKPNFSFHKTNPTQLSFFINHPINQTKIYDPGPSVCCRFTHPISGCFSTSLTHILHFKKPTSQPKILLHKISNLKTQIQPTYNPLINPIVGSHPTYNHNYSPQPLTHDLKPIHLSTNSQPPQNHQLSSHHLWISFFSPFQQLHLSTSNSFPQQRRPQHSNLLVGPPNGNHRSSRKLSNVVTTFPLTNCEKFFIKRQNLLPFEIAQESFATMKVKYPSFHLEDKVILVGWGIVRTCNGRAQNQGTPQKQDKEEDTKARQQLDHYENADTWQIKSRVVRGERGIKIEEKKERGQRHFFQEKNRQLWLRRRVPSLSKARPFGEEKSEGEEEEESPASRMLVKEA